MEVTKVAPESQKLIQAYDRNGFTIAGEHVTGSILIAGERVTSWAPTAFEEIDAASLAALEPGAGDEPAVEILVVGTGHEFRMVPPAMRASVRAWGPVIEAMSTPAACRTYNILLAEGRRVAAALLTAGGA